MAISTVFSAQRMTNVLGDKSYIPSQVVWFSLRLVSDCLGNITFGEEGR